MLPDIKSTLHLICLFTVPLPSMEAAERGGIVPVPFILYPQRLEECQEQRRRPETFMNAQLKLDDSYFIHLKNCLYKETDSPPEASRRKQPC